MSCDGNIRDFFQLLAGTLVRNDGGILGFNIKMSYPFFPCDCIGSDCDKSLKIEQGFGADNCGSAAILLTTCEGDGCLFLDYNGSLLTGLDGKYIKFC